MNSSLFCCHCCTMYPPNKFEFSKLMADVMEIVCSKCRESTLIIKCDNCETNSNNQLLSSLSIGNLR